MTDSELTAGPLGILPCARDLLRACAALPDALPGDGLDDWSPEDEGLLIVEPAM